MPTIGIDYTSAVHQSAGIGRYTFELGHALARLTPTDTYRLFVAGVDKAFTFTCPLPGKNFSWQPTRLSERWLTRLWYRLQLPWPVEYWTGNLDLFHAPDFFLPPVKAGTRTVVTIHDLSFVREPETTMPGMSHHLNTWVPRSVARADHVIAVSETTRQDLIELYQTPPEKISVLYHGVGPEFKPVQDENKLRAIQQKYHLPKQPFILSVGTLQPRKNYQRLIRAVASLDSSLSLVIVGSKGWHYDAIFAEVTRLGLEQRVHFPGFIADADLPALYRAAMVFVYPSLYEGFGLPALESMACGTPVIAANRSALPEVVGAAGLLVDPYDEPALVAAIAQVVEDEQLQAHLSQAGQLQAKKFCWDDTASQLVCLYHKLLGSE